MEKYFILSVALFAWGVCAQTTDIIIETDVSGSDELQTGMASTPMPPSDAPEITSVVSGPEETGSPSNTESAAEGEESTTESEQPTQPTNEEATNQQENQNTESGIETEDSTSEGTNQQESEPDTEEGITTTQPPTENPVMPQEDTTPQPAMQEDTPPQSAMQENTTPQPEMQENTSLQPTTQDNTTPQLSTQKEAGPQPETQETNMTPETTTMQEEMETEGSREQVQTVPESSFDQETNTVRDETPASEPPGIAEIATTITTSSTAEEQRNPTESLDDKNNEPVRSAVEGAAVTVMIETEDASTEGVIKADGPKVDSAIDKDETACPTDCTAGTGDPICGSDQRVYESECHLKRDTCGKNITVASWELCRGKHDICPAQCLNIQDPVCGEDGKIYPNLCLMFKFNCGRRMRTYDLVRCVNTYRGFRRVDGACPKVCHELYRPVCGSDGKVYSNDCYLRLQTCGRNVQIVEMSRCVDTPRCPHTCTPLYDPVCGSDGRMYLNHCYFANLTCKKNIAKVNLRYCESFQHLK